MKLTRTCFTDSQVQAGLSVEGPHLKAWLLADPLSICVSSFRFAAILRVNALRGQVYAATQVPSAFAYPALVLPQCLWQRGGVSQGSCSAGKSEGRKHGVQTAHLEGLFYTGQVVEVDDAKAALLCYCGGRAVALLLTNVFYNNIFLAVHFASLGSISMQSCRRGCTAGKQPP